MLETVLSFIPDKKKRNVAYAAGGMLALLTGQKLVGLSLFAKSVKGLEKVWRREHPEFEGGLRERFDRALAFYEETHQDPTNRKLHVVGIPIILGGTAGLLIFAPFRPLWFVSAGAFSFGWILNFIGHGVFEKNAPAFADDPLSFLAGPVWDLKNMLGGNRVVVDEDGTVTVDAEITVTGTSAVA